jgi:hypothetical protein
MWSRFEVYPWNIDVPLAEVRVWEFSRCNKLPIICKFQDEQDGLMFKKKKIWEFFAALEFSLRVYPCSDRQRAINTKWPETKINKDSSLQLLVTKYDSILGDRQQIN